MKGLGCYRSETRGIADERGEFRREPVRDAAFSVVSSTGKEQIIQDECA
jgi:hypothetical protein